MSKTYYILLAVGFNLRLWISPISSSHQEPYNHLEPMRVLQMHKYWSRLTHIQGLILYALVASKGRLLQWHGPLQLSIGHQVPTIRRFPLQLAKPQGARVENLQTQNAARR